MVVVVCVRLSRRRFQVRISAIRLRFPFSLLNQSRLRPVYNLIALFVQNKHGLASTYNIVLLDRLDCLCWLNNECVGFVFTIWKNPKKVDPYLEKTVSILVFPCLFVFSVFWRPRVRWLWHESPPCRYHTHASLNDECN